MAKQQAYFTIEQLADQVGYSAGYLRELERRGEIPVAARAGTEHRALRIYDQDDVRELRRILDERRLALAV